MDLIELAAGTDVGKQRQDNQDTFINMKLWSNDQALIGVIDGVGGYEGGDKAAAIAKASIEQYMSTPKGDALSMLKEAVVFANNKIDEERAKDPAYAKMCCVLTIAVADAKNQQLYYAHVGDTRLYRLRSGQLEKITKDHSLVGVREDAGELNEEEAMQHSLRNVILRQVGSEFHRIDDPEFLDFGQTDFSGGDTILVCSDGLSDMVNRAQITSALDKQAPLTGKVRSLIALANEMGGNDNITLVIAKNRARPKPQHHQKVTPAAVIMTAPSNTDQPEHRPSKKNKSLLIAIAAGLLILLAAWWFTRPASPQTTGEPEPSLHSQAVTNNATETNPGAGSTSKFNIDSLLAETIGINGKELFLGQLQTDTIRVSKIIQLVEIIQVSGSKTKRQVLMPARGFEKSTAFEVTGDEKADTIRLKNLVIKNFETGIRVGSKALILLDDVLFENVTNPVVYISGADSLRLKKISVE